MRLVMKFASWLGRLMGNDARLDARLERLRRGEY